MAQNVSVSKSLLRGLSFFINPKMLVPFFGILSAVMVLIYFGIYQYLGLYFQNPLNNVYYYEYGYSTIALSMLFIFGFILSVIYFLEVSVLLQHASDNKLRLGARKLLSESLNNYPRFLVAALLEGLVVLGGTILLVIPAFYLGTRTMLVSVLPIYKNLGPFSALKESNKLTKPIFFKCLSVFTFYVVLGAVLFYLWGGLTSGTVYVFLINGLTIAFLLIAYLISSISILNQLESSEYAKSGFSYLESHIKSIKPY